MIKDLVLLAPIWLSAVGGLVVLALDLLTPRGVGRRHLAYVSSFFLALSGLWAWKLWSSGPELESVYLQSIFVLDLYGAFFAALVVLAAIGACLFAVGHLESHDMDRGEYYALVVFSTTGALIFLTARDFVTLFLGLEVMSLAAYVLAASKKQSPYSTEAGMKYFVLGGVGSAMLLFGASLLYGSTGSLDVVAMGTHFLEHDPGRNYLLPQFAMLLLAVAFLFKIAAVPFHMWAPDVYEGSPSPVVVFMAAGIKAVGVAVLGRVMLTVFQNDVFLDFPVSLPGILLVLSILTMTLGNLLGVVQRNVKRILAYSSIAHAGYILLGIYAVVGPNDETGGQLLNMGVPFYVLVYAIASMGAFGVVSIVTADGDEDAHLEKFAGLARKRPYLSLLLLASLLSLAGVPPLAGFMGKFVLFKEVLRADPGGNVPFVVIAVLNSLVGLYYYLRIAVYVYFREPASDAPADAADAPIRTAPGLVFASLLAVLLLHAGVFPAKYIALSSKVAERSALVSASVAVSDSKVGGRPPRSLARASLRAGSYLH